MYTVCIYVHECWIVETESKFSIGFSIFNWIFHFKLGFLYSIGFSIFVLKARFLVLIVPIPGHCLSRCYCTEEKDQL